MTFVRNILFDTTSTETFYLTRLVLTGNYTSDGKIVINSISQVINNYWNLPGACEINHDHILGLYIDERLDHICM